MGFVDHEWTWICGFTECRIFSQILNGKVEGSPTVKRMKGKKETKLFQPLRTLEPLTPALLPFSLFNTVHQSQKLSMSVRQEDVKFLGDQGVFN